MNMLRRIASRLFVGGSLASALLAASASVFAQQGEWRSTYQRTIASKPVVTAPAPKKPIVVWEEDEIVGEAEPVTHEPARMAAEPARMVVEPARMVPAQPRTVYQPVRTAHEPAHVVHEPARRMPPPQNRSVRNAPPGYGPVRQASAGFVPKHQRVQSAQFLAQDPMPENLPVPAGPMGAGAAPPGLAAPAMPGNSVVAPNGRRVINGGGPTYYSGNEFSGEVPFGGEVFDGHGAGGGCSSCGGGGGDCGSCGGGECITDCYPCLDPRNLDVFSGVFGFTNPTNRGGAGSFGYTFGLNKGRPLVCFPCSNLGMQFGVAGNFANFDGGAFANGGALANTPDSRSQLFLTGGIFRRVDWGFQTGVVFDYLHDDWYSTADLGQIRGELSWVYPYAHEIGFWFATGVNGSNQNGRFFQNGVPVVVNEAWEATDMYAFFYRMRFQERGGEGRMFGGFTGDGDGLFGSDFTVPLTDNWAIQGGYTYLLPQTDNRVLGNANEAWNVAINFVWSPGVCRNSGAIDYNRPLFNVANNGNFIVKRRLLP